MGIRDFFIYFMIGVFLLFISILLGEQAPWYFAWLIGTVMIILISVCGGVLFEGQQSEERQEEGGSET